MVEFANHSYHLSIGRPDGKANTRDTQRIADVRAERVVALIMRAFPMKVQFKIAEDRRETDRRRR